MRFDCFFTSIGHDRVFVFLLFLFGGYRFRSLCVGIRTEAACVGRRGRGEKPAAEGEKLGLV